ncbi:MAG TPA: glutathione transferase GstA [Byssovorax sp.]
MKLYFSPGACSLSPHIALREAGVAFELEAVTLATKVTKHGDDFNAVNPKGMVPTLALDDGDVLTEGPAIVQLIADMKPDAKLAPANGTRARYHLQEWLNFISTELHKQFSPLFAKDTPDSVKDQQRERIGKKLDHVVKQLGERPYLMGDFTVADAYLYTVLRWGRLTGVDVAKWPSLVAFMDRVEERPAVTAALEAEGLKKSKRPS